MLRSKTITPKPAWQNVIILVYATVALVIDDYHTVLGKEHLDTNLFYLIIPLVLLWVFRCSPATYGFHIGNWRRGLWLTLGGWLLSTPILWLVARTRAFNGYYAHIWDAGGFWGTLWWAIQDLFGWEFFFRGFLLFTFAEIAGPWAILLQAIPFTFAHLGKPELEALSCIVGGSAFGWVAWETDSFFYPFLIHMFVSVFTVWVATLY